MLSVLGGLSCRETSAQRGARRTRAPAPRGGVPLSPSNPEAAPRDDFPRRHQSRKVQRDKSWFATAETWPLKGCVRVRGSTPAGFPGARPWVESCQLAHDTGPPDSAPGRGRGTQPNPPLPERLRLAQPQG